MATNRTFSFTQMSQWEWHACPPAPPCPPLLPASHLCLHHSSLQLSHLRPQRATLLQQGGALGCPRPHVPHSLLHRELGAVSAFANRRSFRPPFLPGRPLHPLCCKPLAHGPCLAFSRSCSLFDPSQLRMTFFLVACQRRHRRFQRCRLLVRRRKLLCRFPGGGGSVLLGGKKLALQSCAAFALAPLRRRQAIVSPGRFGADAFHLRCVFLHTSNEQRKHRK